ncbi:MAG: tail fiber domain-containing protein [Candidatus Margulisiibacteriota bacterium]
MLKKILITIVLIGGLSCSAYAIPNNISLQGIINPRPAENTRIDFKFYSDINNPNSGFSTVAKFVKYTNNAGGLYVDEKGFFTATLGYSGTFPDGTCVEVVIDPLGTPTILTPKQLLLSVPFAYKAKVAESLDPTAMLGFVSKTGDKMTGLLTVETNNMYGGNPPNAIYGVMKHYSGVGVYGLAYDPSGSSLEETIGVKGRGGRYGGYFEAVKGSNTGASVYAKGALQIPGLYAVNDSTSPAIKAENSGSGNGIFAYNSNAGDQNYALFAKSEKGMGVYGYSAGTTANAYGLYGWSTGGTGVYGRGATGGIFTGTTRGLIVTTSSGLGITSTNNSANTGDSAIAGYAASGYALYGSNNSTQPSINGSNNGSGPGVKGITYGTTYGAPIGVLGSSSYGKGVYGETTGTSLTNSSIGVYGQSQGGVGVMGVSKSTSGYGGWFSNTGTGIGLYADNNTGTALYANGSVGGRFDSYGGHAIEANSTTSYAIVAETQSGAFAIKGKNSQSSGAAIYGQNDAGYGIYGTSAAAANGAGVYGVSSAAVPGVVAANGSGGLSFLARGGRAKIATDGTNYNSPGLWFSQQTSNYSAMTDAAFVGIADANFNSVGFWGNKGANWGLTMDVANGNVRIDKGTVSVGWVYGNMAPTGGMVTAGWTTGVGHRVMGALAMQSSPAYGVFGAVTKSTDWAGYFSGNVMIAGLAYCSNNVWSSDMRLKTNVKQLANVLPRALKLRGVEYDWIKNSKTEHYPEGKQIGLIAQEVEKEFPEIVVTGSDGYKSLDYGKVTAILLEAIREQQKEIDELKKIVNIIKK